MDTYCRDEKPASSPGPSSPRSRSSAEDGPPDAVRESEELFRALFENANDAIFLHEMLPDFSPGRYLMVNDIACSRLGYSREELLAKSPSEIVSPVHAPNIPAIARTIRLRGHATFDAIHRRKDGTEFPVEISTHLFVLHGRQVSLSIARDITERKQMEEAIRASGQQLHSILDGSSIPQFVINRNHEVIYWNRALERYSGVRARDVRGTTLAWKAFYDDKRPVLADLLLDNEIDKIPEWYPDKCSSSRYVEGAYEATDFFPKIGKNGTWLHFAAVVVRDEEGEVIGALETFEDVTDRKKAEEELKGSEQYLKTIFDSVQTGLVMIDPKTRTIVDANPAAVRLIGAKKDAIIGTVCEDSICHGRKGRCPVIDLRQSVENVESLLVKADGKKIPVLKTAVPVIVSGYPYILESFLDITDRKRAEDAMQRAYFELEQKVQERTIELSELTRNLLEEIAERKTLQEEIAASLREKEILLKEIHHRVKNNMQVISSILNLQAKMIRDPGSREAIRESQNRVTSIALIHEKLYQSKSLAEISFGDYLRKMGDYLLSSYSITPEKARIEVHAENILLPIHRAIPVSLIINELISNSLKYAFPGKRSGIISVRLRREDDHYSLVIGDNGIGLPGGFDLNRTETLGIQLVVSLVDQIQGTLAVNGTDGTEFRIEFPVETAGGDHA